MKTILTIFILLFCLTSQAQRFFGFPKQGAEYVPDTIATFFGNTTSGIPANNTQVNTTSPVANLPWLNTGSGSTAGGNSGATITRGPFTDVLTAAVCPTPIVGYQSFWTRTSRYTSNSPMTMSITNLPAGTYKIWIAGSRPSPSTATMTVTVGSSSDSHSVTNNCGGAYSEITGIIVSAGGTINISIDPNGGGNSYVNVLYIIRTGP